MPAAVDRLAAGPTGRSNTVHLAAAQSGGSSFTLLIMMALVIGVAWFFMIRPQQRRAREVAKMQSAISPGDEIVTIGGLIGTVDSIDDKFVFLEVAPGVVTKYRRQAIAQVLTPAADNHEESGEGGSLDGSAPDDRQVVDH